jgi:hypothetical protein
MNSRIDLLYRLLKLYPVRAVRESFQIKEREQGEVLLEVSTKRTEADILDFAFYELQLDKTACLSIKAQDQAFVGNPENAVVRHLPL